MQNPFPPLATPDVSDGPVEPARDALRISESRYRRLFETAQDGILLLNADTAQIEDVNPYLIDMLGYSHAEFLGKKLWEVGPFADRAESKEMFAQLQAQGYVRYEDLPLKTKTGARVEVEFVSNTYNCDGIRVIQCNIRNITDRKVAEAKLERNTRLYAALSQCNKAIVHCTSAAELLPQICCSAVEFGGMKMGWIGFIDAETRLVQPAASFGDGAEHVRDMKISADGDSPFGRGPTGTAMHEDRPYWCQDYLNDPATIPWREQAARAGWAASASLPLRKDGVVVGTFNLYSGEANSFDELARNLLVEMASDISFALDNFTHEAQRRRTEERLLAAEEQFRGLVEQTIAGIYIIQNRKFVYVNPRFAAIVGQGSAQELIGTDPVACVVVAERDKVAEVLRHLTTSEQHSIAFEFGILRRDGVVIQAGANAARAQHDGHTAIIGMLQDISEKSRSDEEIRRYVKQLKAAFMSTVGLATTISEMRDPYTAGHERRVAQIAVAIGSELGLDAQQLEGLKVAGHLHDIGKITIPTEILCKPGKLSPIEFQLIQGHAMASYEVLKGVEFPWAVAQVALQHHERMDGSGYPKGLKGNEILFDARIMAVADVVEAMSSHRPYRPGLGIASALEEIERGRGTAYDTEAADACLRVFRQKNYQLPA